MLESNTHTLESLFDQLGLASSEAEIDAFIASHQLSADVKLEDADFWDSGQREFFREAREADADWVTVVDDLDALLRRQAQVAGHLPV